MQLFKDRIGGGSPLEGLAVLVVGSHEVIDGGGDENSGTIEFAIHIREFAGTCMEHCHNTQHEDNSMLLRWDIEHGNLRTALA